MENTDLNVTPEEVVAKFEAKINEKTESLVSKTEMEDLKNELSSIKKLAETDNTVELKAKFVELESSLEGLKESSKETKTKVNKVIFRGFMMIAYLKAKEIISKIMY